eukprot:g11519.t1
MVKLKMMTVLGKRKSAELFGTDSPGSPAKSATSGTESRFCGSALDSLDSPAKSATELCNDSMDADAAAGVIRRGTLKPLLHTPLISAPTTVQPAGENSVIFQGLKSKAVEDDPSPDKTGSLRASFRLNLGSGDKRAEFLRYVEAVEGPLKNKAPLSNSNLVPSLTDWCTRTPQNAKHVALCAITDQFQRVPRLRNGSADVALPPFRKEEAVRYGRPHEWDVSRDLHWAVCDVDPNPYVARLVWFFKGDFSCVKPGETYDDAGCGEKLRYRCQKHEVTNLGTRELYLDIATLHTDRLGIVISAGSSKVLLSGAAPKMLSGLDIFLRDNHGGTLQEKATCMRLILSHSSKDLSTIIADASGVPGQVLTAFTFVAAILVTTVDFSQVNYIRTDGTQLLYLVLNFLRKLSLLSLIAVLTFPLPPVEKLWTMYNDSWEKKQMTRAQLKFLVRTEPIGAFLQSQLHYLAAASISMLAPIHLVMLTIDLVQFFMELPHYSKSYSPADSKTGEFYDFMNGRELHQREPPNWLSQKGGSRCSAHFWQYNPFAAFMYCAFPAWAIWLVLSIQRLVIIVLNLHTATRVMEHFSAARPGAKATMQGFRSEIEFFKSMLRECACAAIAGLFAPYASYDCYSFFYYKISALLNPEFSQESNGLTAGQNALQTFNIVQNIFTRMILVALAFWLILGNVPWFVWRFRLVARDFDYTDEELAHLFDSSWAKHEEQIEELILDQFVKNPDVEEDELEPSDEELEEGEKDEKVKDGYNRAADDFGGDHDEQLFFKDLEDVHDEGRRRETNSDRSDEQDEDHNADEQIMDKQKTTSSTGKFVLRDLDRSRTGETGAPAPDTASGQQLLLGVRIGMQSRE